MKKRRKTNTIPGNRKYTISDFNTEFPNDARLMRIFYVRWPDDRPQASRILDAYALTDRVSLLVGLAVASVALMALSFFTPSF
ncbi:MAG: hypothetical protein WBE76_27920 [Terracidiphilus sp.]